jgi:CRISPR/Cas system endoribonuclease Cas6 (RAMP superfamily)
MSVLNYFQFARYLIQLQAKEQILMPPYSGSTLRGGFGAAFKKLVCVTEVARLREAECQDCTLNKVCPYPSLFETAPSVDAQQLRAYSDVPRPFIIEPLGTSGVYQVGDEMEFRLTLIGSAIDYLPYFVVAFRELGEMGIGKGRGKYTLTQIWLEPANEEPILVYSWEDEMMQNCSYRMTFMDAEDRAETFPTDQITIRFLTPTRLTHNGRLDDCPEFHVLMGRLLGRISSLSYFHCKEPLQLDFKGLLVDASDIQIVNHQLKWHDWERYSSRQDARMKFGGILGEVTYSGDLKQFAPYLALGEWVHVGKNCTFGLGKYEIIRET